MKRIGVDVGGTFTDFIYVDDETGKVEVYKTSTTPQDPSIAMIDGINAICDKLGIAHDEIQDIFHGTTIATNMVLEHKGARAGMLVDEPLVAGGAVDDVVAIHHQKGAPRHAYSPATSAPSAAAAASSASLTRRSHS